MFFCPSSAHRSFSMVSLLSFNNSSSVLLSTSPWPCCGQGKYVRKRREEKLLAHGWTDSVLDFLCESCLCDQSFLLLLQILNCSKQSNSKKKWNQKHVSSFLQKDSATLLVHLRNAFFRRKSHGDFLFKKDIMLTLKFFGQPGPGSSTCWDLAPVGKGGVTSGSWVPGALGPHSYFLYQVAGL